MNRAGEHGFDLGDDPFNFNGVADHDDRDDGNNREDQSIRSEIVRVDGLCKEYRIGGVGGGKFLRAVRDVSFSINRGRSFGLVGETGSGKSTIGRLVLGLESATSGKVFFKGRDLGEISKQQLRELRRDMQPVSQNPYAALNPRMKVKEILEEPFLIHKTAEKSQILSLVEELLEIVDLPRSAVNRYPHQFSGGQRQRLVIARAIALKPSFVVADEALSALDVSVQAQIINLLRRLQSEFDLTYLFISHDLSVVEYFCDDVGVLYLGRIVELGSREDIFENASHPYTLALRSSAPVFDPTQRGARRRLHIKGEAPFIDINFRGCVFRSRCPIAQEICRHEVPELKEVEAGHKVACHFAPVSADALASAVESMETIGSR